MEPYLMPRDYLETPSSAYLPAYVQSMPATPFLTAESERIQPTYMPRSDYVYSRRENNYGGNQRVKELRVGERKFEKKVRKSSPKILLTYFRLSLLCFCGYSIACLCWYVAERSNYILTQRRKFSPPKHRIKIKKKSWPKICERIFALSNPNFCHLIWGLCQKMLDVDLTFFRVQAHVFNTVE
jgi:hypothetical protein